MKLDLSKIVTERICDFKGAKLKIRPYPRSRGKFAMRDGSILFTSAESLAIFNHCLVSWEGVTDLEGNPLELTDAVKQKIFDSGLAGIADFVLRTNNELLEEMAAQEKN